MVAGPDFTPLAVSHFFPSQKEGASLGTMAGGIGGGGTWIHPHHIIVFRLVYWTDLGGLVSMRQLAVGAAEEQGGGSQEEGEKRNVRPALRRNQYWPTGMVWLITL